MVFYCDFVTGAMTGRFEVVGPAWFKLAMLVLVPIRLRSLLSSGLDCRSDSVGR